MASNSKENEAVVVAFDAYGTLLFTESIAKKLASHFGDEKAKTIATTWRKYQLDSTWRLNSMVFFFPNGTHRKISSSVHNSPDLSPHTKTFEDIVVAEQAKKPKPAPEAYHHLVKKVGMDPKGPKQRERIWLVSGNPFDVVGARAVVMNAIWADRAGNGWQDSLIEAEKGRPTEVVKSLDAVVSTIMSTSRNEMMEEWREMHGQRHTRE